MVLLILLAVVVELLLHHIKAVAEAVKNIKPRDIPIQETFTRLAGLEPLTIKEDTLFINVGERTNVTGSKAFARLIIEEKFEEAVSVARQQVENGAQVIDINMDEGMLDSLQAMQHFLNLIASEPDIARIPIMLDSSKWDVIEAGLKVCARESYSKLHISQRRRGDFFRAC